MSKIFIFSKGFIMKVKCIFLFLPIYGMFSGCSDRNDISSDLEKKERLIIEHCNGTMECACDSIPGIDSYEYKGEKYFCNRRDVLKTAIPPSSNERGVKKIIPILEESHNLCKGDAQYNECFCKKSNFLGTVTIGNTKYLCR